MGTYKSKYVNIVAVERESYTTVITFNNNITERDKTVSIKNPIVEQYFVEKYKHLGITPNNVVDFLKTTDPKYKVEVEDYLKFMDYYFYNTICNEELNSVLED